MGKASFWERVKKVIKESDLVVEVVDARFPEITRNAQLESLVESANKKLLIVMNKADLVSAKKLAENKRKISENFRCVYISSRERKGSGILRAEIGKLLGKAGGKVGVVGYPNTGKSSLINLLRGKAVARKAAEAGFTKGEQWVKISKKIMLIDTPGVIPFDEMSEEKLALICSKTLGQIDDVVAAAEFIIKFIIDEGKVEALKKFYQIKSLSDSASEILEKIAITKKRVKTGGKPDIEVAARIVIKDWQSGKIKIF